MICIIYVLNYGTNIHPRFNRTYHREFNLFSPKNYADQVCKGRAEERELFRSHESPKFWRELLREGVRGGWSEFTGTLLHNVVTFTNHDTRGRGGGYRERSKHWNKNKKKIGRRRRRRKSKSINHSNTGNYSCRISNFQPFILLLFSRSLSMFSENRPENYLIHSSTLIRYLLMLLWNLYISTYIWSRSIFRDHHDFRDWGELRERVLKLLQLQLLTSRKYQNKLLYQKLRSIWWKYRKNGEFACILLLLFFPSLQKIIPMNPYTCVCIYILEHVFIIV